MNIKQVLKEELMKISLSNNELSDLNQRANEIVKKISNGKIQAFIGGSLAKGTLMKKNVQDIDIFVIFEKEEDTLTLENILKKNKFDYKMIHGSRDYFHIEQEDVIFEIIPVLKLDGEPANITDSSLSHVKFVKKQINKNKKLADEIKIAKAFCYAQNVYGAESYIKGFSGYALELLVIYFGGFEKFLKGIVKLSKDKIVIDSEKQFKNKQQIMQELNESKLQSPIVVVDPTYKYRNATAGLSKETFEIFLDSAKKFLKAPSLKFFEKVEVNSEKLKKEAMKKKAKFIEIHFRTEKQEGDIAGTKMKKFFDFIVSGLERKEQRVLLKAFDYKEGQDAVGYLGVKENNEIEVRGPPKKNKEAVESFKRVRKKIYFKKDIAFAKEKISLDDIFAQLKRSEEEMKVMFEII